MNLNSEISKRKNLCQGDRVAFVFFMAFFAFLAWQVTHPLVKALMWAGMLSFIFKPVYKRIMELTRGRYRSLSAAVTLSLMAVVFIIPLIYIFASLGSETSKIIDTIAAFLARNKINQNTDLAQLTPHLTPIWLPEWLKGHFYNFLMDSEAVKDSVQKTAQWVGGNLTDISKYLIQGASSFLMEMILVPMISFFFIRDGDKIVDYIKSVTPLSTEEKRCFSPKQKNF